MLGKQSSKLAGQPALMDSHIMANLQIFLQTVLRLAPGCKVTLEETHEHSNINFNINILNKRYKVL